MIERAYLKASNLASFDLFGRSLAISGDSMVVGAYRKDSGNSTDGSDNSAASSGAVYVFCRQNDGTWLEEAYLKASNLGEHDGFGFSVAVSGDTVVIGASGEDSGNAADGSDDSERNSGAAYVFRRQNDGTWLEEAYLKASNLGEGDGFGFSVAVSGDTVVIGASGEDSGNAGNGADDSDKSSGAAYVFRRQNDGAWLEEAYLKASNTGAGDLFGNVAVFGDTVVVGARREDSSNPADGSDNSARDSGAVYVFRRQGDSTWLEEAYLKASNLAGADPFDFNGDKFGESVALWGDLLVVGAPGADHDNPVDEGDDSGSDAGAAHVFRRQNDGTWLEEAFLRASNIDDYDQFGESVAVFDETVVVGAPLEDSGDATDGSSNSTREAGAAYLFRRQNDGTWPEETYLKASNAGVIDEFGRFVAISSDTIVVGAPREASGSPSNKRDNSSFNSGAVYVYERFTDGPVSPGPDLAVTQLDYTPMANRIEFGALLVGAESVSERFLLRNQGGEPLVGLSVNLAGPDPSVFSVLPVLPDILMPGECVVLELQFAPSSEEVFQATLEITSNDPQQALIEVPLNGAGRFPLSLDGNGYLKASNLGEADLFGSVVAVSGDTMVVGAPGEDSGSSADGSDNSVDDTGAVYVFRRQSNGAWIEEAYLKASNVERRDAFGSSVGISGDTLVVGAPSEDSGIAAEGADNSLGESGAVYVFRRLSDGTWIEEAYLKASNLGNADFFGSSVGISGDSVVVGAPHEDSGNAADGNDNSVDRAGAAYVFRRQSNGTWIEDAFLKSSNPSNGQKFGASVAVSADTVVVGAPWRGFGRAGAAYVFRRHSDGGGWLEEARLAAAYTRFEDRFGGSVAVSGDTVVVGAPEQNGGNPADIRDSSAFDSGAIHIFRKPSDGIWFEEAYLKASNLGSRDRFGFSVGVSGNTVLVGAPQESGGNAADGADNSVFSSGAAYIFRRQINGAWLEEAYLKASNLGLRDHFGSSVAISGNTMVVGAPEESSGNPRDEDDNSADHSGAAYVIGEPLPPTPFIEVTDLGGSQIVDHIDFGIILIGKASPAEKIVVQNQGNAPLLELSASLTGADVNDFTFSPALPDSLRPGESVVLELQFAPTTDKIFQADLSITSNDPLQGLIQISLNGDGRFPLTVTGSEYLKASNPEWSDEFGTSVAVSGDTMVVGAPLEDSGIANDGGDNSELNSGAIYIFRRQSSGTWLEEAYLKASNLGSFDEFGASVAISGDTVVVGVPSESGRNPANENGSFIYSSGTAYVFRRQIDGTWAEEAYLRASNIGSRDGFGCAVAISGNTLVVGARHEASSNPADASDNTGSFSGAAYVFRRKIDGAWEEEAYLKASNIGIGDTFGSAVGISGDTLVVGAYQESGGNPADGNDDSETNSGAAYVFRRQSNGTWIEEAYLKASNLGTFDRFGRSVAVSGNTVVVGARDENSGNAANGDDDSAFNSGAVYLFRRQVNGEWLEESYLKAANLGANDEFGSSVAISGDTVVVGAPRESSSTADENNNQARSSGAVYIFRRQTDGTWLQRAIRKASNVGESDRFGASVALSDTTMVVGAPFEDSGNAADGSDDSEYNSGAAYVHKISLGATYLIPFFETVANEAHNLTVVDRIPTAVPFRDGVTNLLKYSFNMNLNEPDLTPMTPGGDRGLPLISLTEEGGERLLKFEFVRRRQSGLRYIPEKSLTLEPDSFVPVEGTWTVETINAEWERVQVTEPLDLLDSKSFGRVRILME